ncbi:MAG: TraR/DksA family transcriptional regulator [Arenicella sp.]
MNKQQLESFEEQLLDLQQELMGVADLSEDAAATVELDQTRVGRLSRMDAMQGQAMAAAMNARCEENLLRVKQALERIDDGYYGECFDCGQQIPPARLSIDPAAEFCVNCAALKER